MTTTGGTAERLRVGLIGTGIIGTPMAARLLSAGLLARVWNRTLDRTQPLQRRGAQVAHSPAEVASAADIVCLCLTDAAATEGVLRGPNGLLRGQSPVRPMIIDLSTSSPSETRRLAQIYREATGGCWIDAPVSGGPARAESGELMIYCGGEQADFEMAQPVFAALAQRATRVGPLGSGQTLKLCSQLIAAPTIIAIAEALAVAEANGLAPAAIPELLRGGLADSPLLQLFGAGMATPSATRLGTVYTMLRAIDTGLELARTAGLASPVAAAAAEVYRAAARFDRERDMTELLEVCRGGHGVAPHRPQ